MPTWGTHGARMHPNGLVGACRHTVNYVLSAHSAAGNASDLLAGPFRGFRRQTVTVLNSGSDDPPATLLRHRFVIVADRACHFPDAILVLPQRYELGLADAVLRMLGMVEAMHANLHRSVSLQ